MIKVVIKEVQNMQSDRSGITREFKSLRAAKMFATKNQVFQGTVLKIEDEFEREIAVKYDNEKWIDL